MWPHTACCRYLYFKFINSSIESIIVNKSPFYFLGSRVFLCPAFLTEKMFYIVPKPHLLVPSSASQWVCLNIGHE